MVGIVVATAVLLASDVEAESGRLIRIGALTPSWGPTPAMIGLRDGLQELGYREKKDFVIGVRFTQGNIAELPAAARDLVRQGVDIIVANDGPSAKAAQIATTRIPIVFLGGHDPVGSGLVTSYARPGGNITGITDLERDVLSKRMEIFRELVPGLKRVLLPYDAADPYTVTHLDAYRAAARHLGLTLVERPAGTEAEARVAIGETKKGEVGGVFSPRSVSFNIPGFILDIAPRLALPTMFHIPFFVERGGLASYSRNEREVGRQGARLVHRIIKGAKPSDLPIEQPTKFELVINLNTAKALGLTIPPSILIRADRVIE